MSGCGGAIMNFYLLKNGQVTGPFTEAELRRQLAAGTVSREDMYAVEGDAAWKPLSQSPLAAPPVTNPLPPAPMAPGAYRADPHLMPTPTGGTNSGLAVWALVCGILSLFCGFGTIPGIILGHLALSELKRNPGLTGRGMALTGLIMSYVMLALNIIGGIIFGLFGAIGSMPHSAFFSH